MKLFATLRTALRALRRNTLRTLLTALGIIIGVAAVITMTSIGFGAKAQVEDQIASLGENVMIIMSGSVTRSGVHSGWGGAGTLTVEDGEAILREVEGVSAISLEVRRSMRIAAGSQNWFTTILGESPAYFSMRKWPFLHGEGFTDRDVTTAAKVCVIGTTTARQIFGTPEAAMGQELRVKNVPFVIIGVLASKGNSFMGQDQDDTIIMPYTSAMKRITGDRRLRSVLAQTRSAGELAVAQQQIVGLLRERHGIREGMDDDFMVRSQEDIAAMATATSRIMTVLLGSIASVSLLVGGIGIMNIMLVSVTERTREIGLRLAVGARGRDVLLQFLIEAALISVLGGIGGILLGVGVSEFIRLKLAWPTLLSMTSIVGAFLVSAAIGIFFGFYPARKAAALDPIEALRHE
jgi:putative ABC transport system permease protein